VIYKKMEINNTMIILTDSVRTNEGIQSFHDKIK
jgi:hypothetical protein